MGRSLSCLYFEPVNLVERVGGCENGIGGWGLSGREGEGEGRRWVNGLGRLGVKVLDRDWRLSFTIGFRRIS